MDALLKTIAGSITVQLILPALMLLILLWLMMFVLWRAQKREDFDLANMLRGDEGKESPWRLCTLGAFAISSWALMTEVLSNRLTPEVWWGYLLTWSGAIVMLELAKRWSGDLPFANRSSTAARAPTEPSQ